MVTSHTPLHKTRPQQATPQLLKEDLPLFKDVSKCRQKGKEKNEGKGIDQHKKNKDEVKGRNEKHEGKGRISTKK